MWHTDVRTAAALGVPDDTLGPAAGPSQGGSGSSRRAGSWAHRQGLAGSQGLQPPTSLSLAPGASLRSSKFSATLGLLLWV